MSATDASRPSTGAATGHRPLVGRLVDAGIVLLISLVAAVSSQRWSGFNSPDSEFYASLALFGDEVADRSLDPAYTWTRLGYIAPVRALVSGLGPWAGFEAWRFVLILIVVGSLFAIVRLVSTRELATIVAAFAALNTVVLSYAGNTYLTGSIIAAVCLLLALGAWGAFGTARVAWLPALLSGAVAGWLVMLNPYGLLLGLSMWVGIWLVGARAPGRPWWRNAWRDLGFAALGFALTFGAFLLAGLAIFPGRSWFGTYLDWNSRLDYATFVGDATSWQRDSALLVPVAAALIAVIAVVAVRSRVAVASLVVAGANIAFTVVYLVVVPGPWLEAPTYVAKLWPGALVAVALAFGALVGTQRLGPPAWVLAALTIPLLMWVGRWDQTISASQALLLLVLMLGLTGLAAFALIRFDALVAGALVVVALAAIAVSSQVLQNGRGLVGSYGQYPFRAAFVDFDYELLMRSKIAAQEFVLEQTTADDAVAIWTDPDRMTAAIAAMQLWGWYNNVGSGPTLNAEEGEALESLRPTAIAMYAPSREQIDAFWASLPPWSLPTPPECTTVPYLGIGSPEAHICVTHLRWG